MSDLAGAIPFELLGYTDGPRPTRAAVRIAPADFVHAIAGGFVTTWDTFDVDDRGELAPAPGGLYDEDIFGPLPRTPLGGIDLDAYRIEPLARRPQLRRFGSLVLAAPVLHPWVARFAEDRVLEATGATWEAVEDILVGSSAVSRDGEIVEVDALAEPGDVRSYALGASALQRLARLRSCSFDGGLRILPVLPAGLRAASRREGKLSYKAPTVPYQAVVECSVRVGELLERSRQLAERARAVAELQRYVEALFLDGFDHDFTPAAIGTPLAEVAMQPLAHALTGAFGGGCVGALAAADDVLVALRGELYIWRACAEASCLEVVELDGAGQVDTAIRQGRLRDRNAGDFDEVFTHQLGATWRGLVFHPGGDEAPHVDVYHFDGDGPPDPAIILTAGASTVAMTTGGHGRDPYIELACRTPVELEAATREALGHALYRLAMYPFRFKTWFGPMHDVGIGGPIVEGSGLTAWVLFALDEEWSDRLSDALPRHPTILLAVAITAEEQQFKRDHGGAALRERLARAGALTTDPRRA